MIFSEQCGFCGHTENAYIYSLNIQLVRSLMRLIDGYKRFPLCQGFELKDLGLTNAQHASFQKLQYFGLARHDGNLWNPTGTGVMFAAGKSSILNKVIVFKRKVLPPAHPAYKNIKEQSRLVYIYEVKERNQEQKKDYLNQ